MSKAEPERILLTVREGIDADNLRTEILSDWGEAVTGARLITSGKMPEKGEGDGTE